MLLAVRISSYGCIWEVWRALKKLELLLRIFRALQTSRVYPELDIRTLSMNKFLIKVCGPRSGISLRAVRGKAEKR